MSHIHDLKKYKNAIALLEHIEAVLKVLDLTERSLAHFKGYIPVAKILKEIKDQKTILELYKTISAKEKINKGKRS